MHPEQKGIVPAVSLAESDGDEGFSWAAMGISDIAGGASGAIYAAVINLWPGAGQVAWGVTIVAYALAASAFYAVFSTLWGFVE